MKEPSDQLNTDLRRATEMIGTRLPAVPAGEALLVGVSGIDASGKGFLTARLAAILREAGRRVAPINVDGWLNLPPVRFAAADAPRHFYENALRFDEMFARLILPLKERRAISMRMQYAAETADEFVERQVEFDNIDVILLEGIFLFRPPFRAHFDLKIWIECSPQTALARAIGRAQEQLPPAETKAAYETIYFPAQEIHLRRDRPRETADLVIFNDEPPRSAAR